MMICHYVITKVFIDKFDNANVETKLYVNNKKAYLDFEAMKDDIKAKVAFKYSVPFEDFELEDFASEVIDESNKFVYKDFEGDTNIHLEIKQVIPMI